jgi:hypothetical protein
MIAEKLQLKSASADRGMASLRRRHGIFHRDKIPIQNNFHNSGEKPVNCPRNSLELQDFDPNCF